MLFSEIDASSFHAKDPEQKGSIKSSMLLYGAGRDTVGLQLGTPEDTNSWVSTPFGLKRFTTDSGEPARHQVIRIHLNPSHQKAFDDFDKHMQQVAASLPKDKFLHKSFPEGGAAAVAKNWQPSVRTDDDGLPYITCKVVDPGGYGQLKVYRFNRTTQCWADGEQSDLIARCGFVPTIMPLCLWSQVSGNCGISYRLVSALLDDEARTALDSTSCGIILSGGARMNIGQKRSAGTLHADGPAHDDGDEGGSGSGSGFSSPKANRCKRVRGEPLVEGRPAQDPADIGERDDQATSEPDPDPEPEPETSQ